MKALTLSEITSLKEVFESDYERIRFGFFEDIESEHTKRAYINDLYQFGLFLKAHFGGVRIINAEREHIVAFKRFLRSFGGVKGGPAKDRTVNRKLACISKFYTYLGQKGIVSKNPCEFVKRIKNDFRVESDFFQTEEVKEILNSTSSETLSKSMHKALLYTLFTTGMRVGEVVALKMENILTIKGESYFEYKAMGNRVITKKITSKTFQAIEEYFEWLDESGVSRGRGDFLFRPSRNQVGTTDKGLNTSSVSKVLKSYAKKAGIEREVNPHMIRTTVIGELLESGWDIYRTAEFVGHKELKMTMAYDKKRASLKNDTEGVLGY